jgi:uncharacterized protein YjdB
MKKFLTLTLVSLFFSIASFAVAPITGPTGVCIGAAITMSDATPGGIWTSSNSSIATTSGTTSGIVFGVSPGTATITYTVGGLYATTTITVSAAPGPIFGPSAVCMANTITLSDAVGGGTWSTSGTMIIAAGYSTGIITGITPGTAIVTYSLGTGCDVTKLITVVTSGGTISGSSTVCAGGTVTLADTYPGGTWTSTNTSVAVAGLTTGVVSGLITGTSTITYSLGGSCTSAQIETVISGPASISGPTSVCAGASIALSDATLGGTWTTGSTGVAYAGTTGIVTGVSAGTANITYSIGSGCYVYTTITVYPNSPISGISSVCMGSTTTLSDAVTGGTWTSGNTTIATIGYTTGVVTGSAAGTSVISYTTGSGCVSTQVETVLTAPPAILGPTEVCVSSSNTLSDAITGGTWTSSNTTIATIGLSSGVATGIVAGIVNITYSIGGACSAVMVDTVVTSASPITGVTGVCLGSTTTLSDASGGGYWTSSNYSVASLSGTTSGIVVGVSASTATITYTLGVGCNATTTVTVYPNPAITASNTPQTCGSTDTLKAGGGATYSWSPTTGLSCPTCASAWLDPTTSTTYVVTGTDAFGCVNTASVAVNGNRILGHITFSSFTPDTLDMKVWLIHYNPLDSSIIALDSTSTCIVDSITYYEFDGKAAGHYMVKAKLLFDNPVGGTGYLPSYGLSSAYWYTGDSVVHTSGSDSLHINMVSGIVPPGPGFISGYVYAGAGKGTSGDIPVAGMPIYLQNAASKILTVTYTDATGAYSFGSLAYGTYVIYPEVFDYYTTPSSVITLNTDAASVTGANFKQYLNSRRIVPYGTTEVKPLSADGGIVFFPNPAGNNLNIRWNNQPQGTAYMTITDVFGREVYRSSVSFASPSGQSQINTSGLQDGIYQVTIKSDKIYYSTKLVVQQ